MINISFENDTNLVRIIPDYIYSKPILTVYSVCNDEHKNNLSYKIEKRFPINTNRLELEKYIHSRKQMRNNKEYYTSISIQISQEILNNLKIENNLYNIPFSQAENNTNFVGDISQENKNNLKRAPPLFEKILELLCDTINKEGSAPLRENIELCLISKIDGELFSITPYFNTDQGLEFFIYNSKREYEWYLGLVSNNKIIGLSDKIQIEEKILEYFRDLEMNL